MAQGPKLIILLPKTCVPISWGILPSRSPAPGPSQYHVEERKDFAKGWCCIALNRFRDTEIAASGVFLITVIDVLLSRVNKQGGFEGSHLPISLNEGADEAPGQAISRLSQEAQMDTFEDVSVLSNRSIREAPSSRAGCSTCVQLPSMITNASLRMILLPFNFGT